MHGKVSRDGRGEGKRGLGGRGTVRLWGGRCAAEVNAVSHAHALTYSHTYSIAHTHARGRIFDTRSGRYKVRLDGPGGRAVAVKPENIEVESPGDARRAHK